MNDERTPARATMAAAAQSAGEIIREAALNVAESFREPSFRAGFGAALVSAALLAKAGAPARLAVLASLLIGATAEHLYVLAEDIHETSVAQREYLATLKAAADAPGKV